MRILIIIYVYWMSQLLCILCENDPILLNIDHEQDTNLGGFVDGGYPKPGDIPLLNRKIFRGVRVSTREHPYIASIRRKYTHYLTGTLITKNLVISIAHPLIDVNISEFGVVTGQSYSDRGTLIATVVIIIVHEDFDPYTLAADIALLRLYEDLNFKIAVKPIGLISPKEDLNNKHAFVTGWGRCDRTNKELCLWRSTQYNPGEKIDPMLRTVSFKIVLPNFYCDGYRRHEVDLKPGMMCVGPAREDNPVAPCMAVPGAPLVVRSRLAGMLSWGFGCGYSFDLPLIYTNIQDYQRWLLHNIPILRVIKRTNLTEIFDATRAYVLSQWLFKTRLYKPNFNRQVLKDLVSLKIDFKLAILKGSVYDIRDFIHDGMYREDKRNMYNAIQERVKEYKKLPLNNNIETNIAQSDVKKTKGHLLLKNERVSYETEKNDLEKITNDFNPLPTTTDAYDNVTTNNYD